MKVLFLKHLTDIANIWDIKEVKPWYLRNFLLPKWIAVPVSKKIIQETEFLREKQKKLKQEKIDLAISQKDNINWKTIEFNEKADWSNLYAAITEKDIIKRINDEFKIDLDKKSICHTRIKTTWEHAVELKISEWAIINLTVKVLWNEWEIKNNN